MKITRKNVFETNSSSTHSISLSNTYKIPDFSGKKVIVDRGEFGWEQKSYNDFGTKLSYLGTYIAMNKGSKNFEYDKKILKEVLKETNCESVFFSDEKEYHIDHQSFDVPAEIFSGSEEEIKEKIRKFLFSYRSILITDNDNH